MSGPFVRTALDYIESTDIGSPLPIWFPSGTKAPLVAGHHGYQGAYANTDTVRGWTAQYPRASIGLRLRPEVVGIDIDLYDDKRGAQTIAELQARWGVLPPTWKTTSRTDGSGIRLYRVPLGAATAMRDPKPGAVEVVTYGQRFITCFPSVHPKVHKVYRWVDPDGYRHKRVLRLLAAELPALPVDWLAGLATGSYTHRGKVRLDGSPADWLRARPGGGGRLCEGMRHDARRYVAEVRAAQYGSCYSTMVRGVHALVGNAAEGHRGGLKAVEKLYDAYAKTIQKRKAHARPEAELNREFIRAVRDAIEKLPASKFSDEDDCCMSIRMEVTR